MQIFANQIDTAQPPERGRISRVGLFRHVPWRRHASAAHQFGRFSCHGQATDVSLGKIAKKGYVRLGERCPVGAYTPIAKEIVSGLSKCRAGCHNHAIGWWPTDEAPCFGQPQA